MVASSAGSSLTNVAAVAARAFAVAGPLSYYVFVMSIFALLFSSILFYSLSLSSFLLVHLLPMHHIIIIVIIVIIN